VKTSFPSRGVALDACSACAGDYEDPERTAWADEGLERDEERGDNDAQQPQRREFPVEPE
jgi:hypothetical protein